MSSNVSAALSENKSERFGTQRFYIRDKRTDYTQHLRLNFVESVHKLQQTLDLDIINGGEYITSEEFINAWEKFFANPTSKSSESVFSAVLTLFCLSSDSYKGFRNFYPELDCSFSFFISINTKNALLSTRCALHCLDELICGDVLEDFFKQIT